MTSISFAVLDEDDVILRSGTCPADHVEYQAQGSERVIAMLAGSAVVAGIHYLKGGQFRELPPRPDFPSRFDLEAEAWVDVRNPDAVLKQNALDARAKRDALIAATDWTQLPDVPAATRDLWATYRQGLRDITDQAGFPASIEWPDPPG